MLKKQFRLRKQKDFEEVFKRGAYFSEKFLVVKIKENSMSISRFGFIVSNKISKKSVKRNRIKRVLRESVRLLQKNVIPGFDVVFISKKDIVNRNFKEMSSSVEKLLKKSGLLAK